MEIQILGMWCKNVQAAAFLNEIESNLLKLKLARGDHKSYKHEFRTKNSNYEIERVVIFLKICNNSSFSGFMLLREILEKVKINFFECFWLLQ